MKCRLCEDKLLEYLYGELSQEDVAAVEKHLRESEPCREQARAFASVLDTVTRAEEEEGPPDALHTRIMGHAQEAGSKKRSLWGWVFRPAVTTAVIGAIAAGLYFTTLRHKPPSYRDERIVLEESAPEKSKQRVALSSSHTEADSLGKEEQVLASRAGPAEETAAVAEGRAEPEEREQEAVRNTAPRTIASPYGMEDPFMAAEKTDEEVSPVLERESTEAVRARERGKLAEKAERTMRAPADFSGLAKAPPASVKTDLYMLKTPAPAPIAGALHLASRGYCEDAGKQVDAYFARYPKEEACGAGWLETARCLLKKGDAEAARKMAEKALDIPAYAKEARAFLDSLPPPAE